MSNITTHPLSASPSYLFYTYRSYRQHRQNSFTPPPLSPTPPPLPKNPSPTNPNSVGALVSLLQSHSAPSPSFRSTISGYLTNSDLRTSFTSQQQLSGSPSYQLPSDKNISALAETVGLYGFTVNKLAPILAKNFASTVTSSFSGSSAPPLPRDYQYINRGGTPQTTRTALTDTVLTISTATSTDTLNVSVKWFEKNAKALQALGSTVPHALEQVIPYGATTAIQNYVNLLAAYAEFDLAALTHEFTLYRRYIASQLLIPFTFGFRQGDIIDYFMTQEGFISAQDYLNQLWPLIHQDKLYFGVTAQSAATAISRTSTYLRYTIPPKSTSPADRLRRSNETWKAFRAKGNDWKLFMA